MGRTIALDVGTKTIGVAMSDPLGITANPVCTLGRKGVKKDVVRLMALCEGRDVQTLVVGLPLELDDTETRSAKLARQVGDAMGRALGVKPIYIDERYTSVDAEEALIEADLSRKKRKGVIDQVAAVLILRSYLDYGDWSEI
jgi:putative Holliday junction resolvase